MYVLGLLVTFVVRMDMHKMPVRIIWLISILRSIGSNNNNKDAITRHNTVFKKKVTILYLQNFFDSQTQKVMIIKEDP